MVSKSRLAIILKPPKKILAFSLTTIAFIIIYIRFSLFIASISKPSKYREIKPDGITDVVKVYKNNYSIPLIIANNESDAYFMLGYCQAQDRLWQMDLYRRIAAGRISEIFGSETVYIDKFMRVLNLELISERILKNMDKNALKVLESYSNGINSYIKIHSTQLPFEFGALNYNPENWKPLDCILIQRLYAFESSESFTNDMILGLIAEKIGINAASELLTQYPSDAPCVLEDTLYKTQKNQEISDSNKNNTNPQYISSLSILKEAVSKISDIKKTLNLGNNLGSNIWAVRQNIKDKNLKRAILAADPHSTINLPARWEQVHLSYPGVNIIGMTIPGIPFIFYGRNDNISWGMASMKLDDCDFFIEKIDSSNSNFYINQESKKIKFKYIPDTIRVHEREPVIYYQRATERSIVISDFMPFSYKSLFLNKKDKFNDASYFQKYCITFSWTATINSDELGSLYKISKAKSWEQFKSALYSWKSPGEIFCYADKNSNIGIIPVAAVPDRESQCKSWMPNPGWQPECSWKSIIKEPQDEYLYNPKKNFVFAANNKVSKNKTSYFSNYWEPSSRTERIDSLLRTTEYYDQRNAQLMQIDLFSQYSKDILLECLPILKNNYNNMGAIQKEALESLNAFDCFMTPMSANPTIYTAFLEKLLYNTYANKLTNEDLYLKFISMTDISSRKLNELLEMKDEPKNDSIQKTKYFTINKNDLILKSFNEAVEYLRKYFDSNDLNDWLYGKIHKVNFRHYISFFDYGGSAVNIGPFVIGGDNTTVNNTEWNYSHPYELEQAASMRFICDMSDSVVNFVIPGGASGEPLGDNYSDQVQLWLNGGYVTMSSMTNHLENYTLFILATPNKK